MIALGISRLAYCFIAGLQGPCTGHGGSDDPHRQLLQTADHGQCPIWRDAGRRCTSHMGATIAPRCCAFPRRDVSKTALSTDHATPIWPLRFLLAAGLDGIERGLDAGPPNHRNMYAVSVRRARVRAFASCRPRSMKLSTRWRPTRSFVRPSAKSLPRPISRRGVSSGTTITPRCRSGRLIDMSTHTEQCCSAYSDLPKVELHCDPASHLPDPVQRRTRRP